MHASTRTHEAFASATLYVLLSRRLLLLLFLPLLLPLLLPPPKSFILCALGLLARPSSNLKSAASRASPSPPERLIGSVSTPSRKGNVGNVRPSSSASLRRRCSCVAATEKAVASRSAPPDPVTPPRAAIVALMAEASCVAICWTRKASPACWASSLLASAAA
eukprot:6200545-Pleurochrysis_carterae.AAC.1